MGNYASVGDSYTKGQSDELYPSKTIFDEAINARYTKTESDTLFQQKGDYAMRSDILNTIKSIPSLDNVYTKGESDTRYPALATYDAAIKIANDGLAARYTKGESDGLYVSKTVFDVANKAGNDELAARYTKTESDGRYPTLTTYNTDKTNTNDGLSARYTKTESDGRYPALATYSSAIKIANDGLAARYTKTESDGLYVSKPVFDAANKVGNDGLAARYTKTEVDTKVTSLVNNNTLTDLKPKTMWCADGDLCQVPTGKKGFTNGVITIDGQTIKNDKTAGTTGRLYLSGSEKLYVLNKEGVVIGKESGANGNLSVQGDMNVAGDIAGIRLSNGWTGYPNTFANKSEISNDLGTYKALMIAGNKSADNTRRKIQMYDDVHVEGGITANGTANIAGTADIAGIRLSNNWTGYPDEKRGGAWKSEISNDVVEHQSLMLVGNRSNGGAARKIKMYDDVHVGGNFGVGGKNIWLHDTNININAGDDWIRLLRDNTDLNSFNRGLAALNLYAAQDIFGKRNMAIDGNISVGGDIAGIRLSNTWTDYPNASKSEISNDVNVYKSLMIAGNKSGGGARKISMWDDVSVNGDLYAQGKIYGAGNRDVIADLDDIRNNINDLKNNVVRKDRKYAIKNDDGRRLQMNDRGEAKAVGNDPWGNWEKMNFVEGS